MNIKKHRIACIIAIIIGSVFLGMGAGWEIGLGVGFISWAGLPVIKK